VATVQLQGSKGLQLVDVSCENSELEFTKPSQSDSGAIAFDVVLRSDAAPGDEGGKITLELTEGPSRQMFTVPYFGTVATAP
jgi:hypothetical protein